MAEAILSGLVVAWFGGLSWFAYKHQEPYAQNYIHVIGISFLLGIAAISWDVFLTILWLDLRDAIPAASRAAARSVIRGYMLDTVITSSLAFGGVLWMMLLAQLPKILGKKTA